MSDLRHIHTITLPDDCIRRDMGDIDALAKSIDDVGLLQPVVLLADGTLLAGRRRLAAVQKLGWDAVPVRVAHDLTDAAKLLRAQRDENTCRKAFTPSEAVAMKQAIKAIEAPKAKERQRQGQRKGRESAKRPKKAPKAKTQENKEIPVCPNVGTNGNANGTHSSPGRVAEVAADATGIGAETLRKAEAVVEAAAADPEKFGDLKEQMDATGKVHSAFKELAKRKAKPAKDGIGIPLSEKAESLWAVGELAAEMRKCLRRAGELAHEIAEHPGGAWYRMSLKRTVQRAGDAAEQESVRFRCTHVDNALHNLNDHLPYVSVCPYCESESPGETSRTCTGCKGLGWGPKSLYTRANAEAKAAVDALAAAGAD